MEIHIIQELTDISDSVFKIQDIMKKRRKILNVLENGDHSNLSSLEGLDHELSLECHNWRKLHGRPEDQQELGQSVLQQLVDHDRPEVLLEARPVVAMQEGGSRGPTSPTTHHHPMQGRRRTDIIQF